MADTRDQAVEHAVQDWATLTETIPIGEVALISDASNLEINRLNARAQHYRAERGELGDIEVQVPGVHYGIRAGDRVAMIDQHHQPGAERVENGARGEVIDINDDRRGPCPVRRHQPMADTRRRRARAPTARLREPHPPCARRDRHAHARRDRRLADQQGARLRRGIPRPRRHRLVRQPPRPRHRRPRQRPHQTPRTGHGPQPHANTITRLP